MKCIRFLIISLFASLAINASAWPFVPAKQVSVDPSAIAVSTGTTVQVVLEDLSDALTDSFTNCTFTTPGYLQLPSGHILQWGMGPEAPYAAEHIITYPKPFPNACLGVFASMSWTIGDGTTQLSDAIIGITKRIGYEKTQAVVGSRRTLQGYRWFAIGY